MDESVRSRVGAALGRIPSGVYIVVAGGPDGQKTGMLASWIQQASFSPPQVTVAVKSERYVNEWLTDGSPVTINQVPKGDSVLFRHFGKGFEPDADAFDGVDCRDGENGLPVLSAALVTLEGNVRGRMNAGDHSIVLVELTNATELPECRQAEPFVHTRRNGFSY